MNDENKVPRKHKRSDEAFKRQAVECLAELCCDGGPVVNQGTAGTQEAGPRIG